MTTDKREWERLPGWVYRIFDHSGRCLYVGVSLNPADRFTQHKKTHWWPDVDRIEQDRYFTREMAEKVEDVVIAALRPIHNKARNHGEDETDPTTIAMALDLMAMRWGKPPRIRGIEDRRAEFRELLDNSHRVAGEAIRETREKLVAQ